MRAAEQMAPKAALPARPVNRLARPTNASPHREETMRRIELPRDANLGAVLIVLVARAGGEVRITNTELYEG
jgi:hypothetical protein